MEGGVEVSDQGRDQGKGQDRGRGRGKVKDGGRRVRSRFVSGSMKAEVRTQRVTTRKKITPMKTTNSAEPTCHLNVIKTTYSIINEPE